MNATQQEQLLNIGTYLRDVRQEKGKDIDEVANQIFIRPALVRAIEAGDWESLPEPVFVQGFIRRYADYLGLDGRDLSKKFEPTPVSVLPNPELANRSGVEGVINPQDKHGLKVLSKAEPVPNGASLKQPVSSGRNWTWLYALAGIAALVGLIAWLTSRNTPQTATAPTPEEEEVVTDNETAVDSDDEADDPVAETEPVDEAIAEPESSPEAASTSDAPLTFAVNIESDAWMRVTADGERVYEGILTAGTQQSWTAQNELRITAGNSGEVMYSFNGSEEKPMGAPGSVSNLTLTPGAEAPSSAQ